VFPFLKVEHDLDIANTSRADTSPFLHQAGTLTNARASSSRSSVCGYRIRNPIATMSTRVTVDRVGASSDQDCKMHHPIGNDSFRGHFKYRNFTSSSTAHVTETFLAEDPRATCYSQSTITIRHQERTSLSLQVQAWYI
jgi:hypothetical protein